MKMMWIWTRYLALFLILGIVGCGNGTSNGHIPTVVSNNGATVQSGAGCPAGTLYSSQYNSCLQQGSCYPGWALSPADYLGRSQCIPVTTGNQTNVGGGTVTYGCSQPGQVWSTAYQVCATSTAQCPAGYAWYVNQCIAL